MRLVRLPILLLALWSVALAAGCGAPTDPTQNRAPPTGSDYPAGPYGYGQGTIIENLNFIGKQSDTHTDYTTLPMQPFTLGDVRQNAKLILIDGAARWCGPCNLDQPNVRDVEAAYASRGVVTMEVLVEGGYGVAATDND